MKQSYPVTICQEQGYTVVHIPDFEINTQGETVAEAMQMARDAIEMCGCYLQDQKREIPAPSRLDSLLSEKKEPVALVEVDFDAYRAKCDSGMVCTEVTLPSWLNDAAERAGINFSATLQKAIKAELRL